MIVKFPGNKQRICQWKCSNILCFNFSFRTHVIVSLLKQYKIYFTRNNDSNELMNKFCDLIYKLYEFNEHVAMHTHRTDEQIDQNLSICKSICSFVFVVVC